MSSDLETRVRRANPLTRSDQLERLFGDDASGRLLRDIRRAGPMTETTKERTLTAAPTRPRRGWLIAAGPAAVTVLLAGTLIVISANAGPDSAAPPAGTDPVSVVTSAYEALNAGDVDGLMQHYTDSAFENPAQTTVLYEVLAAINTRIEVLEPCRLIDAGQVECVVLEANDFHGAGGITITRRELFTVNDASRISGVDVTVLSFTQPGYYTFTQVFWDWMRETYPDVHAEIRPALITHLPQDPEHIRAALGYLDEFLAQSDPYPVTDGS